MRIETKDLTIELEPELLTDKHVGRVKALVELALTYEKTKLAMDIQNLAQAEKLRSPKTQKPAT